MTFALWSEVDLLFVSTVAVTEWERSVKRLMAIIATTAGLLALPYAPQAQASTCGLATACFRDYYSSPAHTSPVGYYDIYCGGAVLRGGTTSPYSTYTVQSCNP